MNWDRIRKFNILRLNFILGPLLARLSPSAQSRPTWPAARVGLVFCLVGHLPHLIVCSWSVSTLLVWSPTGQIRGIQAIICAFGVLGFVSCYGNL
ncbi:hypothetical protein DSO57_1039649 [Entomophthora muscae]|uniref:Uncharacterized protein n=1 Tax=Entomophthora muscae TaxID=34485 RepID=A0ACC2S3D1_9FUNG|nr:hypothetical protein DSO57_1039649 [Entomophthora muscae]